LQEKGFIFWKMNSKLRLHRFQVGFKSMHRCQPSGILK
jgi:hypothetical protein